MKPKFIFKANDDVLSFCACRDVPAMSSGQHWRDHFNLSLELTPPSDISI